jgi:hypothetical protein
MRTHVITAAALSKKNAFKIIFGRAYCLLVFYSTYLKEPKYVDTTEIIHT